MIAFISEAVRLFLMAMLGGAITAAAVLVASMLFSMLMRGIDWLETRSRLDDN